MLSRLVAAILSVSTGRAAFIAFLLMVAGGYLLFQFAPYAEVRSFAGDAPLPEEGTAYEGGVASFLEELGVEGRRIYLEFQFWDLLNPFLHAVTFMLLIGWLIRRSRFEHNWARLAVLIPLLTGAADLIENMLLIEAINTYPGPGSGSALIPPVTAAKFLGAVMVMATTAFLAVIAYLRRRAAPAVALIVILALSAVATTAHARKAPPPTGKPPSPPALRGKEPFAPLFEEFLAAQEAKVSTCCGSGVAPWAYRGKTFGDKTSLRSYVSNSADRDWTSSFARLLMRKSDWDSIGHCRTSSKPCAGVNEFPFVSVQFSSARPIYALLDFERRCGQVFRADQPLGTIHFADRADSLFGMIQRALPGDTLFQTLTLPPERTGPNLEGQLSQIDSVLVEELPEAIKKVPPAYPEAGRKAGVQGTVFIQALVGEDGSVRDAFVMNSIPHLDDAALDAVWRWKFNPAKTDGKPIAVWVAIPVKFTLH